MPAGNTELYKQARTKRGLSAQQKERGRLATRLLKAQLRDYGVSPEDLYYTMSLSAKTTLRNHINSGTVTLAELLLINDYYPLNMDAIFQQMRDPHVPFAMSNEEQKYETRSNTPVVSDTEFTEDELAFAAALGIDVE